MSSKKLEISDRERELIDNVAKRIVNSELEAPAIMLLQTIKPLIWIGGELAYFYLAPFLPLLDERGYEFLDTFEKRENIERLIKRVEYLHRAHEREKEKTQGPSKWSRLRKIFSRKTKTKITTELS
ncbi:MAG: hypothetical protein JSW00_06280 [Thermoplasmata archaeon]|nr:MAG: hypothetical protein JSW00_06280 [Thermoplasmata archaeon]